jgi:hypothetical protein
MEKQYGILWTDRGGEYNFTHAQVLAQIATKVVEGYTGEMWLKNHYGQTRLAFAQEDGVYARIDVITAETCELSNEEFAALTFPILRVAMPRGRFKMYYPLSMRDDFPWEGRQWDEGSSDCYRLGLEYYKKELGITVSEVPTPKNYTIQMMSYAKVNMFVENFESSGFEQVLVPEEGDALLIQSGLATFDGPDHVGIYVSNNNFLHHYRGRMSTIQPYNSMWQQKTNMVLRHKNRV